MTSTEFARKQTAHLLDRLAENLRRVRDEPDEDVIHDLRVSIRRFKAALRTFEPEFKRSAVRKIRRALDQVMEPSGFVRDRDVIAKLALEGGVFASSAFIAQLRAERGDGCRRLMSALEPVIENSESWSERLGL